MRKYLGGAAIALIISGTMPLAKCLACELIIQNTSSHVLTNVDLDGNIWTGSIQPGQTISIVFIPENKCTDHGNIRSSDEYTWTFDIYQCGEAMFGHIYYPYYYRTFWPSQSRFYAASLAKFQK